MSLHNHYLLISCGDFYQTQIVSFAELDDAYLDMIAGGSRDVSDHERQATLTALHNQENWEHEHPVGPVRYRVDFEDRYFEVIRMRGKMHG